MDSAKPGDARLRWVIVAVYAAAIFVQSALPSAIDAPSWPGTDKAMHLIAYVLMAVLICRALVAHPMAGRSVVQIALTGAILSALYGGTDELHQALVPARSADVFDWIADSVGSACGALFWAVRQGRAQI